MFGSPKNLSMVFGLVAALFVSACDQTETPVTTSDDQQTSATQTKSGITSIEDVRLEAGLAATVADPLASGTARWESLTDRVTFTCEVEDVTTSGNHEVRVNGVVVGFVNVVAGFGDLNMDSRDGDSIPTMNVGDRVQVRNPSGRVILRGRLILN